MKAGKVIGAAVLLLGIALLGGGGANAAHETLPPSVWAWGDNAFGQLGNGDTLMQTLPVQTQGPSGLPVMEPVARIQAGLGYSVALKLDGTVWTWGDNAFGQLGNGAMGEDSLIPVQVLAPGGTGTLNEIIAIAAGNDHVLALRTDGTVWAWGRNAYGQLGDGTSLDTALPIQVKGTFGIGNLTNIAAISAGAMHSLAIQSDGTVLTWGRNNVGQLGDGTLMDRLTPVPLALTQVVAVSAGEQHTLALTADKTVWAWGDNTYGQLGIGALPVQAANPIPVIGGMKKIVAGGNHSLALMTDGSVWAWGCNASGQVGDGTSFNCLLPTTIIDPSGTGYLKDVVDLSAGDSHSVALQKDGVVWAWGSNVFGQLGDGTTTDRLMPERVRMDGGFLDKISAIEAGRFYTLAIRSECVVNGTVTLEDNFHYAGPITFEFRPTGGGEGVVLTTTLGMQGDFLFCQLPWGNFDVAVKGPKWLRQTIKNANTSGYHNVLDLQFFLKAGDANNDNYIDVFDLDAFILAFDSIPGDLNWNENADFNGDNYVDVMDLDILIRNFDAQGDP